MRALPFSNFRYFIHCETLRFASQSSRHQNFPGIPWVNGSPCGVPKGFYSVMIAVFDSQDAGIWAIAGLRDLSMIRPQSCALIRQIPRIVTSLRYTI